MGTSATGFEHVVAGSAYIPTLSTENTEPQETRSCWETILLVEDEPFVRDVTQEVLETCGYTVLSASNADQGIRTFERHHGPVHLLITDVVMPGMNGREFANRLLQRCPDLKTIFISGYSDNAVLREGAGTAGYLQKPFTMEALTRKVRELINDRSRAARAAVQ
jgi:two-component system cell cycle sensor histidine kinase/response regulator CckA